MALRLILFFGTFLSVLFGAHLVLYFSAIRFFAITNPTVKTVLLWSLFGLAISFFISAALIRLHGNWLFNAYYFVSAVWVGLLVQLLMAMILVWMAVGIAGLLHLRLPLIQISSIVLGLAVLLTGYGVRNAFHTVVKSVGISIPSLPTSWEGKTIVQLSDLHLGAIHRSGFLKDAVQKTNALKPDFIAITGDLFDGMDGDLSSFSAILSELKAKEGVYFVTGNHESYLGLDKAIPIIQKTPIRYLDDEIVNLDGVQLVGVGFPMAGNGKDPTKVFTSAAFDPKKPTILLYHTPTNVAEVHDGFGSQQIGTYWSPDLDYSYAKQKGVVLQLSGHTHQGQFPPFSWMAHSFYRGRDHGLFTDGAFNLYVSGGVGTWGPPVRLFNKPEIVQIRLKK